MIVAITMTDSIPHYGLRMLEAARSVDKMTHSMITSKALTVEDQPHLGKIENVGEFYQLIRPECILGRIIQNIIYHLSDTICNLE